MEYSYLLENSGNKDLEFNDIVNNHNICILNILCYHVNIENKYPFLQFMMEKVPYCNNIVKEQLTFPSIIIRNSSDSLKNVVLERVKSGLDMLGCDFNRVMDDMYKGIIFTIICYGLLILCDTGIFFVKIASFSVYTNACIFLSENKPAILKAIKLFSIKLRLFSTMMIISTSLPSISVPTA